MGRITKFLKGMAMIVRNPWLVNHVLDNDAVNREAVRCGYHLPNGLPSLELTDLCPLPLPVVEPYTFLDGGSTAVDLALLKSLAAQKKDCEYFEIGTWRGESVANVASVAKHCTTLNLPDAEMRSRGWDEKYIGLHRFFSNGLKNVTHLQHNSLSYDFSSLHGKFDLIFVDGDHHYESVRSDTANAFRLLRDENSMIVWHDYGNTPADVRWDVLRGILDGTPENKRKYLFRVTHSLCAIYTTRPLRSFYPDAHPTPDKVFSVRMDVSKL